MPWVYLLLAVVALAAAFRTTSPWVLAVCLLAALGLAVAWLMAMLARRIEDRAGSAALLVDPAELQRLREQAEARRAAASAEASPAARDPSTP